jgi:multicomponent Na+:H+ antiporter subunit F
MTDIYLGMAWLLLLSVLVGLVRIVIGPRPADRMLAAQLLGSSAVAALLLLAQAHGLQALRDVALVIALLAVVAAAAFVDWPPRSGGGGADDDR